MYRLGMSVNPLKPTQSCVRKTMSASLKKGTSSMRLAYMCFTIRERISKGSCISNSFSEYGFALCQCQVCTRPRVSTL